VFYRSNTIWVGVRVRMN